MIRTQSAPNAVPELPASNAPDSDGTSGRIVAFDRHARARHGGRARAAPAARVLSADGQALVRAGFRALLESGGRISVVGEASTGEEAVAQARRLRPDVVLIDATLPGLNCVEATGRMLADPGVAVMLLTATEEDERIFATLRAGARGQLLKDTEPDELVRAVELLARGDAVLSPSLTRRLIAELASVPDPQLPSSDLLDELTPREREVVALVALGLSNPDIAQRLVISPATSKTHVSRAMLKLGAHDRAQLVTFAFHAGLAVPRTQAPAPDALAPTTAGATPIAV
jgi:DNA-binding NarL/FixJ family response regulator